MGLKAWNNFKIMTSPGSATSITQARSLQETLIAIILLVGAVGTTASCATLLPLPPAPHTEIQRVRQEFLGGRTVGLSYYPSAWDGMYEGEGATGRHAFGLNTLTGKYESAFYVKLRNQSDAPVQVASSHFGLITVNGQTYSPGAATTSTSHPFPTTELGPQAWTEGYIVFELPLDVLRRDRPSILQYDDGAGTRAVRYLSIADMVRHEGLSSGVSEETEAGPPLPREMEQERHWIPGHWVNQWIPGRRYEGVWYPGRYETFWIEGRWK
jgi:Domain of unknown function (DUF4352)